MKKEVTIVIATRNDNKLFEINQLLGSYPILIKSLNEFESIPIVEENGKTFYENAYKKSSFIADLLGLPALADDSGLVVEELGGLPGIKSARYAGVGATDTQRCDKLLNELGNNVKRDAFFQCVISLAVPSGLALTYEGSSYGSITYERVGTSGFGYDPIFLCQKFGKTFAQLTTVQKSLVSHRGIALGKLCAEFSSVLKWINLNFLSG